jgi:hypothetical protein
MAPAKSTMGLVFVKAKKEKVSELIDKLSCQDFGELGSDVRPFLGVHGVGSFDAYIVVQCPDAVDLSRFVRESLRGHLSDVVADTQTYVGWPAFFDLGAVESTGRDRPTAAETHVGGASLHEKM